MIHDGKSRKLPFDPAEAVAHLRAKDAKLGALIDRAGPFTLRLDPLPSPFESLLESILYQQLHGKAAATTLRRNCCWIRQTSRCAPPASPATRSKRCAIWQPAPLMAQCPPMRPSSK
jgi:hypothetical protein